MFSLLALLQSLLSSLLLVCCVTRNLPAGHQCRRRLCDSTPTPTTVIASSLSPSAFRLCIYLLRIGRLQLTTQTAKPKNHSFRCFFFFFSSLEPSNRLSYSQTAWNIHASPLGADILHICKNGAVQARSSAQAHLYVTYKP